jgi:hypothetical protein
VKHRDLAEAVSRQEGADQLAVADHLSLPLFDYVKTIASISLAEDFFACEGMNGLDIQREVVECGHRQRAEQRDVDENLDLQRRRRGARARRCQWYVRRSDSPRLSFVVR